MIDGCQSLATCSVLEAESSIDSGSSVDEVHPPRPAQGVHATLRMRLQCDIRRWVLVRRWAGGGGGGGHLHPQRKRWPGDAALGVGCGRHHSRISLASRLPTAAAPATPSHPLPTRVSLLLPSFPTLQARRPHHSPTLQARPYTLTLDPEP